MLYLADVLRDMETEEVGCAFDGETPVFLVPEGFWTEERLAALREHKDVFLSATKHTRDLLSPYADLIEAARHRQLMCGQQVRLSSWEKSDDLNKTVLNAVRVCLCGLLTGESLAVMVARAQPELLERCRLAHCNLGDAIDIP